jgi:transcription antitermination factor NusG
MNTVKKWHAVYTRPRWEKKVNLLLQNKGFESYCPLNKVKKKWTDRVKLIEEPLFKSYVFVKLSAEEQSSVRYIDGLVNFVYWLGKPAVIKEIEIERIKLFLNEYTDVSVRPIALAAGSKVVIKAGILMDREAKVVSNRKNLVEVELESLGCKLIAFIEKKQLEILPI